jgi:hypothetical protein
MADGIIQGVQRAQAQGGKLMADRVRPRVVLHAVLCRVVEHYVAVTAADRTTERRCATVAGVEPSAEGHETPAWTADDVRPTHDLAQFKERVDGIGIRAGQGRALLQARCLSCTWLTTVAPHAPQPSRSPRAG